MIVLELPLSILFIKSGVRTNYCLKNKSLRDNYWRVFPYLLIRGILLTTSACPDRYPAVENYVGILGFILFLYPLYYPIIDLYLSPNIIGKKSFITIFWSKPTT